MSLKSVVERECMLWGDAEAGYYDVSETRMDSQWDHFIAPRLHADLTVTMDFACGRGRNTRKLLENGARHVYAVDVHPENIERIKSRFARQPVTPILNNGMDLAGVASETCTLVYSWDAMVHFDLRLIAGYLEEFRRVLHPGGTVFMHHSNYSSRPGAAFLTNPHARNYMTADLLRHLGMRAGLEVVSQDIVAWGGEADLDCISMLRRPR